MKTKLQHALFGDTVLFSSQACLLHVYIEGSKTENAHTHRVETDPTFLRLSDCDRGWVKNDVDDPSLTARTNTTKHREAGSPSPARCPSWSEEVREVQV